MKYARWIAAVMLLAAAGAGAQETPTPQFAASGKAVLFSFSGLANLNLNEFEGGIGGKYFIGNTVAVRGGVTFAIAGRSLPASPPPGQTGTDGSVSATQLGLSAALEFHLTKSRVQPYLGGGLGYSVTSTESKDAVIGTAAQTTIKNNRNGETIDGASYFGGGTLRIFGAAGVEYFVGQDISLAAEYRLGYAVTSRSDEDRISGNTTVTTKMGSTDLLGLSTGGVLSLAVYF